MELDLLGIFGAGSLTFLTPCVLPLVPIYLAALTGGRLEDVQGMARGQLMLRALLFSAGFVSVFVLMGLGASSAGAALAAHRPLVQALGATLVLLFGLKFVGFIEIPLFDRVVRGSDARFRHSASGLGALAMGALFAAGWSPCVGPVLGSVLTYTATATSDPLTGGLYLGVYGVGFALPLLITAAFAEAGASWLRRIYPWLPRIERAMGAVLLVVGLSMMWDATPSVAPEAMAQPGPAVAAAQAPKGRMVELYARDCPICQEMKPVVDRLTTRCEGQRVAIEQYDISTATHRHLVGHHRVVGVPTFLFLDEQGREAARLVGRQSPEALEQALAAVTGQQCPGLGQVPVVPPRLAAPAGGGAGADGAHVACDVPGISASSSAPPSGAVCGSPVL